MTPDELRERNNGYSRKWRANNAEKNRQSSRAWNAANPRKRLAAQLRVYGLTPDQYDDMLEAQGGACKVCGGAPLRKRLVVDHDHKTGEVRGLLCERCNTRLAALDDTWLAKARAYLEQT